MDVLQVWLLAGIPALAAALLLFVHRSPIRALVGYVVLLVGFGVVTAFHPPSGAVFAGILALLYAAGRGGDFESEVVPTYREQAADDPATTDALRS